MGGLFLVCNCLSYWLSSLTAALILSLLTTAS